MLLEDTPQSEPSTLSDMQGTPRQSKGRKPKTRLIIKKIRLYNFKSYYGEHIIGPLNWVSYSPLKTPKHFTAVVGPNGSGKSNLLECLVFVFGKRASKMRLKQLKELIHCSKDHQDCRRAEVTVFFEELIEDTTNDSWSPITNSQFSIGRAVEKTPNDSGQIIEYSMNDQKSTQSEVELLLSKKNLDLVNNRFMILQGEVEQISIMKPMSGDQDRPGLLEYLEEIIGTNKYIPTISDLSLRLDDECLKRRGTFFLFSFFTENE
jgi:structural maintenance of chromosome 4